MKVVVAAVALTLAGCAGSPAKPVAKGAAAKTLAAAPPGTTKVCRDGASTGSNIKRRQCEFLTEDQLRARQEAIEALARRRALGSSGSSDP